MKKVFMLLDKHLEEILLVFGTMVMILLSSRDAPLLQLFHRLV